MEDGGMMRELCYPAFQWSTITGLHQWTGFEVSVNPLLGMNFNSVDPVIWLCYSSCVVL